MVKIGVSKVSITPKFPILMGGHPGKKIAEGVLDDLFCRTMIVDTDDSPSLFISLDLLFISGQDVSVICTDLHRKYPIIAKDRVSIFATHTHSGPLTTGLYGSSCNTNGFMKTVAQRIIESVGLAFDSAEMSQLYISPYTETTSQLAFNARYIMKDDTVETHPWKGDPRIASPEGAVDNEVIVVFAKTLKERILGGIVHYANHPQVLGRECTYLSSDFPGIIETDLKKRLSDPNLVFLFANGCSGDVCPVNPANTADNEVGREYMMLMGEQLSETVAAAVNRAIALEDYSVKSIRRTINFPYRKDVLTSMNRIKELVFQTKSDSGRPTNEKRKLSNWGTEKNRSLCISLEEYLHTGEWYEQELADLNALLKEMQNDSRCTIDISFFYTSELIFIFLPFEVFAEIGMDIKRISGKWKIIPVCIANGSYGYIPTKKAFRRKGGYETKTLTSSKLAPDAGEMIIREVKNMMKEVFGIG